MQEILHVAFSPANFIYSVLLLVVFFYWIGIILGALDLNAIDFDIDAEVDADFDVDVDADLDAGVASVGWWAGALQFFNFGKLPFMFIMSFTLFFAWAISLLAQQYLGHGSLLFAAGLVFPNLFLSLSLTKIITTPLIPAFQNLEAGKEAVDYVGLTCQLVLPANTAKMGQAEVTLEDDTSLLINVKVSEDKPEALYKGDRAVIVAVKGDTDYYLIEKI
ncbi:MAG: hypothetical protein AAFW73_16675 [Bacteroidota bacterium]